MILLEIEFASIVAQLAQDIPQPIPSCVITLPYASSCHPVVESINVVVFVPLILLFSNIINPLPWILLQIVFTRNIALASGQTLITPPHTFEIDILLISANPFTVRSPLIEPH